MVNHEEKWVEGSEQLVHAGYSYWTLGYVLSQTGARKLLGLSSFISFSSYRHFDSITQFITPQMHGHWTT